MCFVSLISLNKLKPFILHISYLCLGHQHPTVKRKSDDVRSDLPRVLLRFQSHNYLIVRVWDKFKGGEAMGGVERSNMAHCDVAEVCRAGQEEVGGAPLICCLVIVLVAGTAREEEPSLETLAPCC